MVRELQSRVAALEAKKEVPAVTIITPVELDVKPAEKPERKMCPKCGVKPAYFFHVRTCTGQKEEQKDAEPIRRRDQGTT
jgi:DNA-directed RNA polymerase subunit M/transcription elongation factor TFIIS